MTPRKKVEKMEILYTLISTAPGIRFDSESGTYFKTGQTQGNIQYCLDINGLLEKHVRAIEGEYGMGRALRFLDWCRGRQINTYWRVHRAQIQEDRVQFVNLIASGGYGRYE